VRLEERLELGREHERARQGGVEQGVSLPVHAPTLARAGGAAYPSRDGSAGLCDPSPGGGENRRPRR
jgi:hypothetical protein